MALTLRSADPETIRKWAEEHGGRPLALRSNLRDGGPEAAVRIGFPGGRRSDAARYEEIAWSEWFRILEKNRLALDYEPSAPEGNSPDSRIVRRDD
jgi:hypothetical protein